MRVIGPVLMSLILLLAAAADGNAASRRNKQSRHYGEAYAAPSVITEEQKRRNARAYERGEYYERDSNALPIGSRAWFEQKEREDGCC